MHLLLTEHRSIKSVGQRYFLQACDVSENCIMSYLPGQAVRSGLIALACNVI